MTVTFSTGTAHTGPTGKRFYIGSPKHIRTMSKKESYAYAAEKTGFTPANIRAVFLAFKKYLQQNAAAGNSTYQDGVADIRISVKGSFEGLNGPWVPGKNYLIVSAIEKDPFKSMLAGIIPTNDTEGAKPLIKTVFDETTKEYDIITGTDVFSIAGTDLGPDTEQADEYVALVDKNGTETKCEVTYSDLQNVKAKLVSALAPGEYTLSIYTRSGMGEEFGVRMASRKITVK